MRDVTLYHNPRCSKSRAALAMVREHGIEPRIIEYLTTPPDASELRRLIAILDGPATSLLRPKEARDLKPENDHDVIEALIRHPSWMERPLVVTDRQAMIARDPQRLRDWLRDR